MIVWARILCMWDRRVIGSVEVRESEFWFSVKKFKIYIQTGIDDSVKYW